MNFWIFQVSWTWEANFLPPTLINQASLQNPTQMVGFWTKRCACGDWLKCGFIEYCDDWELDVPPDSEQRHWCNGEFYEMVHYDWNDKVGCGWGEKRCFCRLRDGVRTDASGDVLPYLWSNCFHYERCTWKVHRRRRLKYFEDCVANECWELDRRYYKGWWQECGIDGYFRGLCEPAP